MKTEKDIEEILDNVKIPSDEEVEAAGMRFDRRIRRLRMRRCVMWATGSVAAVLCCGLVFTSLWMNRGVKENLGVVGIPRVLTTDHQVVVPTLILADGNKLNLKEREADSTAGKSNIRITDDRVIYDTVPAVREIVYNRLIIPTGFTYNVTLADGTEVTLNAGSSLKYPEIFVGKQREVELSGEAYFNVAKSDIPFEISVGGSKIRVYGTRFNVKERPQKTIETVLIEGKIGFKSPGHKEVRVSPGELVSYDMTSTGIKIQPVDVQYATAWLDGVFRYRDKPLDLVLEDISTWYGVSFESREGLDKIEVTMNLNKTTPIDEVVSFLERVTNRKFIKERGYYTVQ